MNTILLPPQRPASTVPPHSPRCTDLREVLFPVELRHLHFLDEKDRPVVLNTHRAVINSDTGQHLGAVGAGSPGASRPRYTIQTWERSHLAGASGAALNGIMRMSTFDARPPEGNTPTPLLWENRL